MMNSYQKVLLDMLVEFKRVADENKIRWWVSDGTLLGAVRHKGFVPWDDDIDVMVDAKDYGRLAEMHYKFKFPYFLQSDITEPGWSGFRKHMQLRNSLTTGCIECDKSRSINRGIFMDVFRLDSLDDSRCGNTFRGVVDCNTWDKADWDGVVTGVFEGVEVPMPKNYRNVLRSSYGDDWETPRKMKTTHGGVPYSSVTVPYREYFGVRRGLTVGAFDILHVGHLNLFDECKKKCKTLTVGVCSDHYIRSVKGHEPVFDETARLRMVQSLKAVDRAFVVSREETEDKSLIFDKDPFDVLFIGSDWANTDRARAAESLFDSRGVKVEYVKYTDGVSSTAIRTGACNGAAK